MFDGQEFELPSDRVSPAMPDDPVLRRLIEGRARIETPDQWAQYASCGAAGKYCAGMAVLLLEQEGTAGSGAWNALARSLPEPWESVPAFNDHSSTTHADILALFDRAIAARKAAGPR